MTSTIIHCRGNVFTELLINNDSSNTHTDWGGFIKYAVEMGPGVMICMPSFVKIGSGVQNLIRGGFTDNMEIA
jgi:hypothetical protein